MFCRWKPMVYMPCSIYRTWRIAQNNPGVCENTKSPGTKLENFVVFNKENSIQCCPLGKAASTCCPFSHTVGLSKGFQIMKLWLILSNNWYILKLRQQMNLQNTCVHDEDLIRYTYSKNSSLIQVRSKDKYAGLGYVISEGCGAAGWTLLPPLWKTPKKNTPQRQQREVTDLCRSLGDWQTYLLPEIPYCQHKFSAELPTGPC